MKILMIIAALFATTAGASPETTTGEIDATSRLAVYELELEQDYRMTQADYLMQDIAVASSASLGYVQGTCNTLMALYDDIRDGTQPDALPLLTYAVRYESIILKKANVANKIIPVCIAMRDSMPLVETTLTDFQMKQVSWRILPNS